MDGMARRVAGDTQDRADTMTRREITPREWWHSLGEDHPGGLCGRFGARNAGAILLACQAYEKARGKPAKDKALEDFKAAVARALIEEE